MQYNFEYARKVRVGFIGCGGHAFRNVFPTFQYAPVELVAVCDLEAERAAHYARQFGAQRHYADHREMLAREELDAVFIVTNCGADGRPLYPLLAADCLRAGCHAWIEKPPAASSEEIRQLVAVSEKTGKFVMVGLKKVFFPAIAKAKEILDDAAFGRPTSLYCRYPQDLPPFDRRTDVFAMRGFLDHLVHPMSIIHHLLGPVETLWYRRTDLNGASVTLLSFANGAVGTLHLAAGQSGTSPLERLEVVGEGANVVVDNGVTLTYYRRGSRGSEGYGRQTAFLGDDGCAPLHWEPEFSLGQLYNKGIFLLGYVQEVAYFCRCVLEGSPPQKAGLDDALALLKLYEAYQQPEGTIVRVH